MARQLALVVVVVARLLCSLHFGPAIGSAARLQLANTATGIKQQLAGMHI